MINFRSKLAAAMQSKLVIQNPESIHHAIDAVLKVIRDELPEVFDNIIAEEWHIQQFDDIKKNTE